MARCRRITDDEALALASRYRQHADLDARRRLVEGHLYLVVRVSGAYRARLSSMADLIQEGNVGLLRAAEKYDLERGVPFRIYAGYWIRSMVLRHLMENRSLVKLGSTRASRALFYNLSRTRQHLAETGIHTSTRALAARLGVTERELTLVDRRLALPELSLDAPIRDDGPGLLEVVPNASARSPEEVVGSRERASLIHDALDAFSRTLRDRRDQIIWQRRLLADEPCSLAELSVQFGVSKQRVQQIEGRLRRRLAQALRTDARFPGPPAPAAA